MTRNPVFYPERKGVFAVMRRILVRPWLTNEDETAFEYSREGLSLSTIAVRLRRTRRAVQTRIGLLKRRIERRSDVALRSETTG